MTEFWKHESTKGRKLNHCPTCGSDVHLERCHEADATYEYWVCDGCYEKFYFRMVPLDPEDPEPYDPRFLVRSKLNRPVPLTPTHDSGCLDTSERSSTVGWQHTTKQLPSGLDFTTEARLERLEKITVHHEENILTLRQEIKELRETIILHQNGEHNQAKTTSEDTLDRLNGVVEVLEAHLSHHPALADLIDLRKKLGYLQEDLRRKESLSMFRAPTVADCARCKGFNNCSRCRIRCD